ncbi:hypothetical protein PR003_g13593 [Phytophthora rubi]|uniref:Uncharacterized protein n=1 Tax=Phytophthora rubi TaxID=129364 RepID=A0A6A4EX37_9STRA|nr:hypothetical protein PR002_g15865 [Phytophthora rubi]KAE9009837.1 hypothetical protein PR001_g16338 [Phytophthora rubi]KAE9334283.1 hypothetical protein PR003_g13593 [Phytophthora rubi]
MVRVVGARWLLLGSSLAAGVGRFVAIARFGDCAACVAASVSARSWRDLGCRFSRRSFRVRSGDLVFVCEGPVSTLLRRPQPKKRPSSTRHQRRRPARCHRGRRTSMPLCCRTQHHAS